MTLVGGGGCVFAGGEHGECRGKLEWHHCVKQQRLKREFKYGVRWDFDDRRWIPADRHKPVLEERAFERTLSEIVGDTRNRIFCCVAHHELVTNGRIYTGIPPEVWAFCAEFELTAQLENDLARRRAA